MATFHGCAGGRGSQALAKMLHEDCCMQGPRQLPHAASMLARGTKTSSSFYGNSTVPAAASAPILFWQFAPPQHELLLSGAIEEVRPAFCRPRLYSRASCFQVVVTVARPLLCASIVIRCAFLRVTVRTTDTIVSIT